MYKKRLASRAGGVIEAVTEDSGEFSINAGPW